jgi:hypothetical protein
VSLDPDTQALSLMGTQVGAGGKEGYLGVYVLGVLRVLPLVRLVQEVLADSGLFCRLLLLLPLLLLPPCKKVCVTHPNLLLLLLLLLCLLLGGTHRRAWLTCCYQRPS